ncbi:hypothetical protein EUGRSUZ_B02787 [Eucalyptus grandis]|uniref:Purple acid phosphatase n=2 Tax=Eucalyptus grandis TaxID=71139 RepID=A0A059D6I5_EUCGR|nr:hypothetical protein EUGRSUZ_B02787 [Eucalyptus grandis]
MEAREVLTHLIAILALAQAAAMMAVMGEGGGAIPTTLDGPFEPVTRRFDPSLRMGSDDLPMDDPRLKKNVTSSFPEQISLALSSDPSSMWVSWITGDAQIGKNVTLLDPSSVTSEVWYSTESGNQLSPFEGLLNYTSGIIHHVRLEGLKSATTYYFKCGDSSVPAMSDEYSFKTMPSPSPNAYPTCIAVIGDLGLTSNSSTTIDHVIKNDPALVLMVGDLTYANQFMEPLTSRMPMMVIEDNHEIEPQVDGITFQSYLTRFAIPSEESHSNSSFYYSFNAGGIHFIMLGAYVDYNTTGTQYSWLMDDLHRVNRSLTPWVVAAWHPPWYNSYNSHYQEFECMRQEMEALLINTKSISCSMAMMNRVYSYTLDPCGPLYITIGDGGNIEKVDVDFADDPGKCPKPEDNKPEFGGLCPLNFSNGPAKGKFCWSKQPEWSAYRESSFGHGILKIVNSTYALWTWHGNQDAYKEDKPGNQIFIVRRPELCSPTVKRSSSRWSRVGTRTPSSTVILSFKTMWLMCLLVASVGIAVR